MKRYICALAVLMLLFVSGMTSAQTVPTSEHMQQFLNFVRDNYLINISRQEADDLNMMEIAWVLGKAFEKEYEWVSTHTVVETREWRQGYLKSLWGQVVDYLLDVNRAFNANVNEQGLIDEAIIGFHGFSPDQHYNDLYQKLRLNSPIPSVQFTYLSSYPAAGRQSQGSGYVYPWRDSLEALVSIDTARGLVLEAPGESYSKGWSNSGNSNGQSLDSDIVNGRSTGGDTGEGSGGGMGDGGSYEVTSGPLFGTWRANLPNGYAEFTFDVSGKSGSFSAKIVKGGQVTKSLSGQLEGYRKDKGEYYQYKAYIGDETEYLEIIKMTSESLNIDFLGARWQLARVQ